MQRVRQRVLPKQDLSGSQGHAHGGVAAQVHGVRPELQSEEQPEDASPDARGRSAGSQDRDLGVVGLEDHVLHRGQTNGRTGERPPADTEEQYAQTRLHYRGHYETLEIYNFNLRAFRLFAYALYHSFSSLRINSLLLHILSSLVIYFITTINCTF